MLHFLLFFYFLVVCVGLFSIFSAYVFKFRFKSVQAGYYALFLLLFLIYGIITFFYTYSYLFKIYQKPAINIIYYLFLFLWFAAVIYCIPFSSHRLINLPFGKLKKTFFLLASCIVVTFLVFSLVLIKSIDEKIYLLKLISDTVFGIALGSIITYSLFTIGTNLKNMTENYHKKTVKRYLYITLLFSPFLVIDFYSEIIAINWKINFQHFKFSMFYYFLLSLVSIYCDGQYFLSSIKTPLDKIHLFKEKYKLTEREIKVLEFLIKGFGTKEIADTLFISPDTIRNYIYKINQKTGTKNRSSIINKFHQESII